VERREFMKTTLISAGAFLTGSGMNCQTDSTTTPLILPTGKPPTKLWALKMTDDLSWAEKNLLTCFQGLVNRNQTRVYLIHSETDQFWLNYYQTEFGIDNEIVAEPNILLEKYAKELSGYIIYDQKMPHSLNLATTLGAIENALPVTKSLESHLSQFGLKQIADLTGRWQHLYDAYEWALQELQPHCHQNLVAQLCVHYPHWSMSTFTNRDYVMTHQIFSVDISSSERDKRDYALMKKIYQAYPEGALVLGWHCVRDKEHEAIALAAEFGHYGLCSLNSPNLTVHSSIQLKAPTKITQRPLHKQDLKVENKVYIAYMATDGDAAWFVQNLIQTDWASPAHGQFKYSWGFLPLAVDLMPGMVQFYFEKMLPNDYFVAGPSGATYTYPHLHPHPEKFLKLSQHYLQQCGLTTVHITNWNDRDWWQEVDLPGFHEQLKKYLPDCVGYVRGMGESAFEPHYLAGGKPYIFCGEAIHRNSDIYQTMRDFIDACPNRPLFIFNLVNHSISMHQVKSEMDKFPTDEIELVNVDELLLLIEKAFEAGKISEELYPQKEGLERIMANEARNAWPAFYQELIEFQDKYKMGESTYLEKLRATPIGLEQINAGEFLAFVTIWHGMKLVKLALESSGVYVNHKPTATRNFMREFHDLSEVALVEELQKLWDRWHQQTVSFSEGKVLAERLLRLAEQLNSLI